MTQETDTSYKILSSAIRQLLLRPKLPQDLKASKTRQDTIKKLGITKDITTEIFNILNVIEQNENKVINGNTDGDKTEENVTDKKFLLESFMQLRNAYRISLTMSVVIFIIGVSFLVLAAVQSFINPQNIATTSVIGGIGIVQVVALFYRNPLIHIARTVSNAQQAKMAIMSYLIGISLLNQQIGTDKPSEDHVKVLLNLTETALGQLQKYTEEVRISENNKETK